MADVAVIFHWSPQQIGDMSPTELMQWRERARVRSGVDDE
ncbi:GpE family phage tail protein [Crenobacter sp. SG2303]|uniref:GpE family phage tail protein n=1 Tax=Crenobacter oryzisoli TaxID=3056844 RepID=A0ABT7XPH6_9NEIS|nr:MULTISPECIES: GpE family phage tail protein [unclassified Crenobacter]MDN0075608.1 GpE family phage tail protein [Crenobacter sp. SG2303]MDN0081622.1 GpE family phage tail protein [Crenobacter sp. SG2305]